MTVGHAPWNHDTIARQITAAQLVADFCAELRMQFKSYVGRVVVAEALDGVKADVLITMQELLPHDIIVVEQDTLQPDLLHIKAYRPTAGGDKGQG